MARIRFEHVEKKYSNGFHAVKDLNLDIQDKEFIVLLGPSGCGKSTTLNMIAGLEDISDGALRFDDEIVNFAPPHRRDVAMVFQSYALYPHKSVFDNIGFGLKMRKVPRDEIERRVREAAGKLEIDHLLDRRPSQLSGGQRQRVALGRAMVREPAAFLMDEPLSNLDAALRISMRAEIKELHRAMQTTFVYVTHDQAEALTLADRIVVMNDGVVQQIGTPDDIYERPKNTFVASFLGNPPINYIDGQIESTDGSTARFRRGDLAFDLPASIAAKLGSSHGREVRLGIRAEDVDETAAGAAGSVIRGKVNSILPVGSDQFLGFDLAGQELFFRVGKDLAHNLGDDVALSVDLNRLHLFDKDSGETLLW
ncbi:ABC transporter ATP-binding protein [Maritimibacter fusiformis]|uniref:sn-glycerol-3-phosphate ABC transporter ATP-binding protein UgpC n=1 Tax=Maritimibacter fusiformis TaxID=2603819 RepID=A0A5D0RJZ3_9RHOB|nr:sn-glycerol-3-phosphate ABC transporter ATP-binding protein UgpC [Maritimibacter fusiformis]TYB81191.1 sn-glycerol-3-phosphate ABC transporter ATP-binding protein UgpC [Maritimibacter fusiformis]